MSAHVLVRVTFGPKLLTDLRHTWVLAGPGKLVASLNNVGQRAVDHSRRTPERLKGSAPKLWSLRQ